PPSFAARCRSREAGLRAGPRALDRRAARLALHRPQSMQSAQTRRRPVTRTASCTIGRMSVPDRVEAARLLLSLSPPPWHLRHSQAVAETAAWLAARIADRGIAVQRPLVEAAALLHDVDKVLAPHDPGRALPHGDGSADWLTRQGHRELARAVANHPVTRLADEARYRRWSAFATR